MEFTKEYLTEFPEVTEWCKHGMMVLCGECYADENYESRHTEEG